MIFGGQKPVPEPAPEPEPRKPTEAEIVHTHTRLRFEELGFTYMQAERLAEERADWWQAKALLERGCPVHLAFDLLSE